MGINILRMLLAVGPDGGVAAFPEAVADLGDTAGTGSAAIALVGLEVRHGGLWRIGWGFLLCFHLSDTLVDTCGGGLTHIVGDVGVDIQRGRGGHMADDGGKGLNIHAVFQSCCGESMPQVVEAYLLALGVFQDDMQAAANRGRVQGRIRLDRGREHPAGMNGLLVLLQRCQQGSGEQKRPVGRLGFRLRDEQTVLCTVDLLVDAQLSGVEVQIIPLQCQQFTTAHARGEFQQKQLVVISFR